MDCNRNGHMSCMVFPFIYIHEIYYVFWMTQAYLFKTNDECFSFMQQYRYFIWWNMKYVLFNLASPRWIQHFVFRLLKCLYHHSQKHSLFVLFPYIHRYKEQLANYRWKYTVMKIEFQYKYILLPYVVLYSNNLLYWCVINFNSLEQKWLE